MLNLMASLICCFSVIISMLLVNESNVEVNFSEDGKVEIWNESQEYYNGFDVEIINAEDRNIVYSESVKEEAMLLE